MSQVAPHLELQQVGVAAAQRLAAQRPQHLVRREARRHLQQFGLASRRRRRQRRRCWQRQRQRQRHHGWLDRSLRLQRPWEQADSVQGLLPSGLA